MRAVAAIFRMMFEVAGRVLAIELVEEDAPGRCRRCRRCLPASGAPGGRWSTGQVRHVGRGPAWRRRSPRRRSCRCGRAAGRNRAFRVLPSRPLHASEEKAVLTLRFAALPPKAHLASGGYPLWCHVVQLAAASPYSTDILHGHAAIWSQMRCLATRRSLCLKV